MTAAPRLCDPDERILQAARHLVLANGYANTSMDEIAREARVSKATLYKRHPSKSALVAAVILEQASRSGMDFKVDEMAELPIREALTKIGARFLDFACSPESRRLELLYHTEAVHLHELAAAYVRSGPETGVAAVEKYMIMAQEKGLIEVEDPRFAAVQFLIAVKGDAFGITPARNSQTSEDVRRDYLRKVVDLFLRGALPRR